MFAPSRTMFPSAILLIFFLVVLSPVNASPVRRLSSGKITLGFTALLNLTHVLNIADADRARVLALSDGRSSHTDSVPAKNVALTYTAQVGVGDPATKYTLVIDTGSSNTWIGANKRYRPTRSSHDTNRTVSLNYGSGSFSGEEWLDKVTLAPNLIIRNQSIGVADTTLGIPKGYDGILGLGPVDLTTGTVSDTYMVPTVVDNLYSQGTISEAIVGMLFEPASNSRSGEITFGGYDSSSITCPIEYTPITTTSPSNQFWGIDQYITYGNTTIMSKTAGIVDTGTTLILLPTNAFVNYTTATGGGMDAATGLLSITQAQYEQLQPLCFHIGENTYELPPNGQIWPRSLNSVVGGSRGQIYLIVSDMGDSGPSGLDFINGYTFLERFYTVYDTAHSRIGFATTKYTDSTKN